MAKNITDLPFTEIVERSMELARLREDVEKKVRGIVNDIYVRDIPQKEDWSFLIANTAITFIAQSAVGNATINTGGSTVTFDSTVTIDSAMNGRKIKFANNDYIYDFSMAGTTAGTIRPTLSGTQNISAGAYAIFQPIYSLPYDFDRFPKNGGLIRFSGGQKEQIPEKGYDYYIQNYSPTPSENQSFCRLLGINTAGNQTFEVVPPPKSAISAQADYLKKLQPLSETTAGLIGTINAGSTQVIGDSNTQFTLARTGDYFRIDNFGTGADSEWYRIIAIQSRSNLTLATAFGLSGATSANYTICSAVDLPTMMQPAVLYGTITHITADQDDPMVQVYAQKYATVLTDGKRVYKTRIYSPEIPTIAEEYRYRY